MLKKLRIKFVTVNMTFITLMLVAIFVVLYISTSRRMEFEAFRGPKPGNDPHPPYEKQIEKQLFEKNPELFDEFAAIAKKEALSNLIRVYLFISVPTFGLFLIISILLSNWMIRPVEENFKKQKQFVSDASHELKTPLTVITTNTEMLADEEGLSEDGMQYVNNILVTSNKMKGLVSGLLELAKSENIERNGKLSPVNFSEVAKRAALPFEPLFFENGLIFSTEISDNIVINGQKDDLSRLVEILLDNTIKYSSSEGEVRLKLSQEGNSACLLVSNTGDEIPENELELIFDRFYRTNKARTGMDSFGLGLALAKQIVSSHNGTISASSENGTNRFTCIFPIK